MTESELPNISGTIGNIAMQSSGNRLSAGGVFSLGSVQNGAVGSGLADVQDGVIMNFGGNSPHNNMQPYVITSYIIKT